MCSSLANVVFYKNQIIENQKFRTRQFCIFSLYQNDCLKMIYVFQKTRCVISQDLVLQTLFFSFSLWRQSSTCELLVFLFAFVVQLYITADLVYRRPMEAHKQNVQHTPNDSAQVGPQDRYPEIAIVTMSINVQKKKIQR